MSMERTENQDDQHQQVARARSLDGTRPPAQVEGYLLRDYLGSGAFGQVWSAVDRTTGRKVAIKFYNRRSVGDIEPLAREVQKLVVLSADRHVVQLLDIGWEADPPYFVMEYLPRGSLEDQLRRDQALPVHQALEIFEEAAIGLMHLHGKGVLHCDLKPGNVLLDNDGKPRLADFGQSRLSDEATPSLGTLFYMAPEQADLDATPDARWDVYALGALLYVMLTGKPPFFDNTLTTEIEASGDIRLRLAVYRKAISTAGPPRRHRQVAGVDRMLAEIIDRCIAIDPQRRYSSIQGVLLALRQRRDTIARRPLVLLGLVGPLLLFGVILAFGWTAYKQAIHDTDRAIRTKATESNSFAAKLAARSAAEQMDEYFRVVDQLANDPAFQDDLRTVLENPDLLELRRKLADPAGNVDPKLEPARAEFRDSPVRLVLQHHLRRRMTSMSRGQVDSWWIYDLYGNQMASVFASSVKPTIGLNYSWRTYFTGLGDELYLPSPGGPPAYQVEADPEKRQHITRPHLSAVFKSDATGTWKVAFSLPVRDEKNGQKIIGVVGLTVRMGDFVEFDAGVQQYALMYDNRPGEHHGIILEHPLLNSLQKQKLPIDPELIKCRLLAPPSPGELFVDPVGKTAAGAAYDKPAVASEAAVEFTDDAQGPESGSQVLRRDSGLRIVVLEDYQKAIEPAHALGQQLSWLGGLATAFLAGVALLMWYLVVRLLRHTRRQLARSFTAHGIEHSTSSLGALQAAGADPSAVPPPGPTLQNSRKTEK